MRTRRSQHFNATYRSTVGRLATIMLRRVAMCCDMSVVVGSNLKIVNPTFVDVACCCSRLVRFLQQCCARACALVRFSTRNMPQRDGQTHATCPTMLRYVVSEFCDRLAGSCKNWANNVAICCAELSRSFARRLRIFWGNCGAKTISHPSNIKRKFSTILLAF